MTSWKIVRDIAAGVGLVLFGMLLEYGATKFVAWRAERANRLDGE